MLRPQLGSLLGLIFIRENLLFLSQCEVYNSGRPTKLHLWA